MFLKNILKSKTKEEECLPNVICSPVNGKIIPLSEVNDPTFAEGLLGPGIAIEPTEDFVYAPVNGKVVSVFPTKHAVGILSDSGMEILLHLGIDTVSLEGKHFKTYVSDGRKIEIGEKLVSYDRNKIEEEGYETPLILIISNADKFGQVTSLVSGEVKQGEQLLMVGSAE